MIKNRGIENREGRRKWLFFAVLVAVMVFLMFPMPVSADFGPKASITVKVENLPEGEVYLDLLIDSPPFTTEDAFRYGEYHWADDPDYYDQKMLAALKEYNVDGWRPALVTGTDLPLWGELRLKVNNGRATADFGYMGVPNRFKIIAVTERGDVVVSNVIEKKSFESVVNFDFATGIAAEKTPALQGLRVFAFSLIATLVIEGLILLLFRFSLRKNLKPFLIINIATQAGLHVGVALAGIALGMFLAIVAYVLLEIVVLIVEAVLFAFFLKEHSKPRRVVFAIVANIVSFIAGIVLFIVSSV